MRSNSPPPLVHALVLPLLLLQEEYGTAVVEVQGEMDGGDARRCLSRGSADSPSLVAKGRVICSTRRTPGWSPLNAVREDESTAGHSHR